MTKKTNWKKELKKIQLAEGFMPPSKMRPVIESFVKSGTIIIQDDLSSPITLPKKSIYLTGGSVRDFIRNKTLKEFHLVSDATPSQIAIILAGNGFHYGGDETLTRGAELDLPKFIKIDGDEKPIKVLQPNGLSRQHRYWYISKRDTSENKIPYSIIAVVENEKFIIETFRKDTGSSYEDSEVEFSDDIRDDSENRDFTINALYIELTKGDGENKILYDPTGTGLSDLQNGDIKLIGDPKKRVENDPVKALRGIRFHSRIGKGDLDKKFPINLDISKIRNRFSSPDYITKELDKGFSCKETDPKKYIKLLLSTGLLGNMFPGLSLADPTELEMENNNFFRNKVNSFAFIFKDEPLDKVNESLSPYIDKNWDKDFIRSIRTLLSIREYNSNDFNKIKNLTESCTLLPSQIKSWVKIIKHYKGEHWFETTKTFLEN